MTFFGSRSVVASTLVFLTCASLALARDKIVEEPPAEPPPAERPGPAGKSESEPKVFSALDFRRRDYSENRPLGRTWQLRLVRGRVIIDGVGAPGEPVLIERACPGATVPEAFTDPAGRFAIDLARDFVPLADASLSDRYLAPSGSPDCEIRAALPGYRSESIQLLGPRRSLHPDLGTLVLYPLHGTRARGASATSAAAPPRARRAFSRGVRAALDDDLPAAYKRLSQAVQLYPRYASAWYWLGVIHAREDEPVSARQAFERACAADPSYVLPHRALYDMAAAAGQWERAAQLTGHLLQLDPEHDARAHYFNAVANLSLERYEPAEVGARAALRLGFEQRDPRARVLLAVVLARQQRHAEAAAELRRFLELHAETEHADRVRAELARIERHTDVR